MTNPNSRAAKLLVRAYQAVINHNRQLNAWAKLGLRPMLRRTAAAARAAMASFGDSLASGYQGVADLVSLLVCAAADLGRRFTAGAGHWFDLAARGDAGMRRPFFKSEILESRVLLSVTAGINGKAVTFTGDNNGNNLYLKVDANNLLEYSTDGTTFTSNLGSGKTLYFPASLSAYTLPAGATSAIGGSITVTLGTGANSLRLDPTLINNLAISGTDLTDNGVGSVEKLISTATPSDLRNTFAISGPGVGTMDELVSFTGVTSLVGGNGDDRFVIAPDFAGTATTSIDGGSGGDNVLSYYGFKTGVNINLTIGTAPKLTSIAHINDVLTGRGNDTIVGGSSPDTLAGGPGQDVITGGTGDTTFLLPQGGWKNVSIIPGTGKNTLDFSNATEDMTFNINGASSTAVENFVTIDAGGNPIPGTNTMHFDASKFNGLVGGQTNNSYVFANGATLGGGTGSIGGSAGPDGATTGVPRGFAGASIDATNTWISFGYGIFFAGQKVTYRANGATIGGLVDGGTYYIAVNPDDSSQFGVANTLFDATSTPPVPIVFSSVNIGAVLPSLTGAFEYTNTLDYSAYTTAISVNLSTGIATGVGSVSQIQKIILGGGNATITGSTEPDVIVFHQPASPQTININPGLGGDLLDFSSFTNAINLDFAVTTSQNVAPNLAVKLGSANAPESVMAGSGNDTIHGNGNNNLIDGGTGTNSLSGSGNITFSALGIVGPLTVQNDPNISGNVLLSSNAAGSIVSDSIAIGSKLSLSGSSFMFLNVTTGGAPLTINAKSVEIAGQVSTRKTAAGANQLTAVSTGDSGKITIKGQNIIVDGGGVLLSQVDANSSFQPGDVAITASVLGRDFVPISQIELASTSITINSGARINGGNIDINSTSNKAHYLTPDSSSNTIDETGSAFLDTELGFLLGALQVTFGFSYSKSTSSITVASGSEIDGENITISTNATTVADGAPFAIAFGQSAAASETYADTTVSGDIIAKGNLTIQATSHHINNVLADVGGAAGIAAALAVNVVRSHANAIVTSTANLHVGGQLNVAGTNFEAERTYARSTAGSDGSVGLALAIVSKNNDTNAILDGTATVVGDINVNAVQDYDKPSVNKLFIIPYFSSGTTAKAGAGGASTGDYLDDTSGSIIDAVAGKVVAFVKSKLIAEEAKTEATKPDTATGASNAPELPKLKDPNDPKFSAAIAVVVANNNVNSRIGDGVNVNKAQSQGSIGVTSGVGDKPAISVDSKSKDPSAPGTQNPNSFAGSAAVGVGIYNDNSHATISTGAIVDAEKSLTLSAKANFQYKPTFLYNLVTPFLFKPDYKSSDGAQKVGNGKIVQVDGGPAFNGNGQQGNIYRYLGNSSSKIDLNKENFTDEGNWEALGNPVAYNAAQFMSALAGYLNANFGVKSIFTNWSSAQAQGNTELGIAGNIMVNLINHDAEAIIDKNAQINQDPAYRPADSVNKPQTVSVSAVSINDAINGGGQIQLPGIDGNAGKFGQTNIHTPVYSSKEKKLAGPFTLVGKEDPLFGNLVTGKDGSGVGFSFQFFDMTNVVKAQINDGVKLHADSLKVNTDNEAFLLDLAASGGKSGNAGFNGAFAVNLVNNTTWSAVSGSAIIDVGKKAVGDVASPNASTDITALDNTFAIEIMGAVAVADHVGVGATVGVNVINRDTEAFIGQQADDNSPIPGKASFSSGADFYINAENTGFVGSFDVSGSVTADTPAPPTASTGLTPDKGVGGSDPVDVTEAGQLPDAAENADSVATDLKDEFGQKSADPLTTEATSPDSAGNNQGEAGISISGSVAINVIANNARSYIRNAGDILVKNSGELLLSSQDSSSAASLAGSAALALGGANPQPNAGIAGSLGINFVSGITDAFVDGAKSLSSGDVNFDATRTGTVVSIVAAGDYASGRQGLAIAGSIAITRTTNTTETAIRNTTATLGSVDLTANDATTAVVAGGALGVGGQAGFGGSGSYTQIDNVIKSDMEHVTDNGIAPLHSGDLNLSALETGLIVAITGSAGLSTQQGSLSTAGTVSINFIGTTVDAHLLAITENKKSTGDENITATDSSSIYAFAGAFAVGRTVGAGASLGLNFLKNTIEAYVEGSLLNTSGSLDANAAEQGVAFVLSVGGAGSEKIAVAGSLAFNRATNTIDSYLSNGSNVIVGGSASFTANDNEALDAIAGALGFSGKAGLGAALGVNSIQDTITAIGDDSIIGSGASIAFSGSDNAKIVDVSIGGAAANKFALAGSLGINKIQNTIKATFTDSNGTGTGKASSLTAAGDVAVKASDSSTIDNLAGAAALNLQGGSAVGGVLSYNAITNGVLADIENTAVNSAAGALVVTATSQPLVISVGGAVAVSIAKGNAGAGTLNINSIANDVNAHIEASTVQTLGDVTVRGSESATLAAISLAGALSATGSTVGVSIAYNYIGGSIDVGNPDVVSFVAGSAGVDENSTPAQVGGSTTVSGTGTTKSSNVVAYIDASSVAAGGTVSVLAGFDNPTSQSNPVPLVQQTDPFAPSTVHVTGDALHFATAHGFTAGQEVVYHTTGTAIGGLTDGQAYYVIPVDANTVKLAATYSDAANGNVIALSTVGSGTSSLTPVNTGGLIGFDPTTTDTLKTTSGVTKITFTLSHGLHQGDEVVYDNGGGTSIGGLTNGHSYYVIFIDAKTIELSNTKNGPAKLLTPPLTSAQNTLTPTIPAAKQNPDTIYTTNSSADTIAFTTEPGVQTGDTVIYKSGGGSQVTGLLDGHTYYVIRPSAASNTIKLAATANNAKNGVAIPLTSTGNALQSLLVVTNEVTAPGVDVPLPTAIGGQIVSVTASTGAVSLNFIRMGVDAHISNTPVSKSVSGAGGVQVLANDTSVIGSGAGGFVVSQNGSALAGAIGVNDISNHVQAHIDAATVSSSNGDVSVNSTERAKDVNVVVGLAGAGGTAAVSGSVAVNNIKDIVGASIQGSSTVTAKKNITVRAVDTASIATLAGNVAINIGGTGAGGLAFAVNNVQDSVLATVDSSNLTATTGDVLVDAEFAKPTDLPPGLDVQIAAMAVSGAVASGALAGAGSVTLNWIKNDVEARIQNISSNKSVTAAGKLSVTASDSSTINSLAGAIAIAGFGTSGASGALGASVSYNYLGGDPNNPGNNTGNIVAARIDNSAGAITGSSITLDATHTGNINNLTLAGAGAGNFALGGAVSINKIHNTSDSHISGASNVNSTQTGSSLSVTAEDNATIAALAGGVGIVISLKGAPGLGVGLGIGVNTISDDTEAYITNSKVKSAGGLNIAATSTPTIKSITLGGAGSVSVGNGPFAAAVAGAGSENDVTNTVKAFVLNSNGANGLTSKGDVVIMATDNPTVDAAAGALAFGGVAGAGGVAGSLGISAAVNNIHDTVYADIDHSVVTATGGNVLVTSKETGRVQALSIGGAIGGSVGGSGAIGIGAAGAGSGNTIINDIQAFIDNGSLVTTINSGNVNVSATDDSTIFANGGGIGIGVGGGDLAGLGVSLGVGVTKNDISDTVHAYVDNSKVTSAGGVNIAAAETASITGATWGGAVAVGVGGFGGVALAAAGADSENNISNDVQAYINNSGGTNAVTATTAVNISATDSSSIDADAGGVAVSVGGSVAIGGALSIGAAVAHNTIHNTVSGYVDHSNLAAGSSGVSIKAIETATSSALTIGGAAAIGAGALGGASLAGAGASSENTVNNIVTAAVRNGALVTTSAGGDVVIEALDTSTVDAKAGGGAIALSGGIGGGSIAVGAAVATNTIANKVEAYVDQPNDASLPVQSPAASTINSAGDITIDATEAADVTALSVAASASASISIGLAFAGAGAGATNNISNTVVASIQGKDSANKSSVTAAGDIDLSATESLTLDSEVGSGAFSAALVGASIGASQSTINDSSTVIASVNNATVNSTGGSVALSANSNDTVTKNLAVMTSVAIAIGAAGGGAVSNITMDVSTRSFVGSGATLTVNKDVDVEAVSSNSDNAQTVAAAAGLLAIGTSVSKVNLGGVTVAHIDGVVTGANVTIAAKETDTAQANSVAAVGGVFASGAGDESTANITPTVQAKLGDNATINSTGAVKVSAQENPSASATALGIAASAGVSIGTSASSANVAGTTLSALGNGAKISASSITVEARRDGDGINPIARAESTAGVGGLLFGANATESHATAGGTVKATTGAVKLIAGSVSITASNQSQQFAKASGVAVGGVLAIGLDDADANSAVKTIAELGNGSQIIVTGALNISANGTDNNIATGIAGSGGLFAGDAAHAETNDSSTVAANLGQGYYIADSVDVAANNNSIVFGRSDSLTANLAGVSGSHVDHNDATSSSATVGSNAIIVAANSIDVTSHNTFQGHDDVSAASGGFFEGTYNGSLTTLNGTSSVIVGDSVHMTVMAPGLPTSDDGIYLRASSGLAMNDNVTLVSGAAIASADSDSILHANLNNNVTLGTGDVLRTNQSIGIGTYTNANSSNSTWLNALGVLGAGGGAVATTDITSNQNVAIGANTNLTALGNIDLNAGTDPRAGVSNPTTFSGVSNAQAYVGGGFAGIPSATGTSSITSNATLTVNTGATIFSGEDATLAADPGDPNAIAKGYGEGNILFVTIYNGTSSPIATTHSNLIMNGVVTSGYFHELNITVPVAASQDPTKIKVNPDGAPKVLLNSNPSQDFFASPVYTQFNPYDTIFNAFGNTPEYPTLRDATAGQGAQAGAMVFGPLFASGGNVTVNAGNIQGSGKITAYGGASVSVTNYSPDYLVLNRIVIPAEIGGDVFYSGKATGAPASIHVQKIGTGTHPVVRIEELYDQALPVPNKSGPSVLMTAAKINNAAAVGFFIPVDEQNNVVPGIENLSGPVFIDVTKGSFITNASISAQSVNVKTNGIFAANLASNNISTGGEPAVARDWNSVMIWPGGNSPNVNNLNPDDAVAYVANYFLNGQGSDVTTFNRRLIGNAFTGLSTGASLSSPFSWVFYGTGVPFTGDNSGLTSQATASQNTANQSSPTGTATAIAPPNNNGNTSDGWFPTVPLKPLSKSVASYPPPSGPQLSAIDATVAVIIRAQYIDVNGKINVGEANGLSLSLPVSLATQIAQYKQNYTNHIPSTTPTDAPGFYTLQLPTQPVTPADTHVSVQFNAITGQIVVNTDLPQASGSVTGDDPGNSASGGNLVELYGGILSTDTRGQINFNTGNGQVAIDNQTGYPIVLNNLAATSRGAAATGRLDVIDSLEPASLSHALYVYRPGTGIDVYRGPATVTAQELESTPNYHSGFFPGNSTSYQPLPGVRYQWQYQASLARTINYTFGGQYGIASSSGTKWVFVNPVKNAGLGPWQYVDPSGNPTDTPYGVVTQTGIPGGVPFYETITAKPYVPSGIGLSLFPGAVTLTENYHSGDLGFFNGPTTGCGLSDPGQCVLWNYVFPTAATLTLTDSIKADNPIAVNFSGLAQGSVVITSNAPVFLDGSIDNPTGDTTITAPSITQIGSSPTITSKNLTLTATAGGVGVTSPSVNGSQSVSASLAANGVLNVQANNQGAYLNLASGAVIGQITAGSAQTGYGDIALDATGNLNIVTGLPIGTDNIIGNNITLTSSSGAIGTAAVPIVVQAHGVLNTHALLDVNLNQGDPDLLVGQIISENGNVTVNVPFGSIVNATGITAAQQLGDSQSQQAWQALGLLNATGAQRVITGFQNEVNAHYADYWRLIPLGNIQNGAFNLTAKGVALYRGQAAASLSISDPASVTDAQVQSYTTSRYVNDVAFFNRNLAANWASLPDFQAFNSNFSYQATNSQKITLIGTTTPSATWTQSQLTNAIARVAIDPTNGTPVAISTPNFSGANVTLSTISNIGQVGTSIFISLADLKSGNLTPAQSAALAAATAPGDVLVQGVNVQNQIVTFPFGPTPAGVTVTGVQVLPTPQIFIAATGVVNASAPSGAVYIQGTTQDLTLGKVVANGAVNITAQGSILSNGPGSSITTNGNLVLMAGTGTLGTPSAHLITAGTGTRTLISHSPSYVNGTTNVAVNPPFNLFFAGAPGGLSKTSAVTLNGTNNATGETVEIFDETTHQDLGITFVAGTKFSIAMNFAEGAHALRARAALNGATADAFITVTVDFTAPTSHVVNSLAQNQSTNSFPVTVAFVDPQTASGGPGSGVVAVDLYVSANNGFFGLYQTQTFASAASGLATFNFTGQDRTSYAFRSVVHDAVGNAENKGGALIEASTSILALNAPVSHILVANPGYSWGSFPASNFSALTPSSYANGLFTLRWAAQDPGQGLGVPAGAISQIDVYVQVDNSAATLIGHSPAGAPNGLGVYTGSLNYIALGDGQSHKYSFFSVAIDPPATQYNGNLQLPSASPDFTLNATIKQTSTTVGFGIFNVPFANVGVGQSATFTATVSSFSGVPATGNVQFIVNGTPYGSPVAITPILGTATLAITEPLGVYNVTAQYLGNVTFAPTLPAAQTPATLTVGLTPTSTSITPSTTSIGLNQPAIFTATVSSPSGAPPTGTVQFFVNGVSYGAAVAISGGQAQLTIPSEPAGVYTIKAQYNGNATYAATLPGSQTSAALNVALIPTSVGVVASVPTIGASLPPPATQNYVSFTATVSSPNGAPPDGTVQFKVNGVAYGSPVPIVGGIASIQNVSFPFSDTYTIQAVYSGGNLYTPSQATTLNYPVTPGPIEPYKVVVSPGNYIGDISIYGYVTNSETITITGNIPTNQNITTVNIRDAAYFFGPPGGNLGNATITGNTFSFTTKLPSLDFGGTSAVGFHQLYVKTITSSFQTSQAFLNVMVDLTTPTSTVNPINANFTDSFPVSVFYNDPDPTGHQADSNISSVDLYVSTNGGPFTLYQTQNIAYSPTSSGTATFNFAGQARYHYDFHSVAHDYAGHTESKASSDIEASVSIPSLNPPVTHILSSNPTYSWNPFLDSKFAGLIPSSYSNGLFTLNWAGAEPELNSGGSLDEVRFFVKIDGGVQQLIDILGGGAPDANGVYIGSTAYNALVDGKAHTYGFYSVGVDDLVHKQYAPLAGPASPDVVFVINPVQTATATVVAPSSVSVGFGQPVLLTATVSSNAGLPLDGAVQFLVNGTNYGAPVALSGNSAQTTISAPTGSYTIAAQYTGDSNYAATLPAAETSASLTVLQVATGTVVTPAFTTTGASQPATFTATVFSANGTPPDGAVQFLVNGVNYGNPMPLSGNMAQLAISEPLGVYTVTAQYTGDTNYAATLPAAETSATVNVTKAATATVVTPGTTSISFGQSSIFTATVSSGNGTPPNGAMQFLVNGANYGNPVSISGGTAQITITEPAGSYMIAAQYTGNADYAVTLPASQTSATLTVSQMATSTAISPASASISSGKSASFTATVSSANGTPPDGFVQFLVNGIPFNSSVALIGGTAQLMITEPVGSYTVAAQYNGDANYAPTLPGDETGGTLTVTAPTGFDLCSATSPFTNGSDALTLKVAGGQVLAWVNHNPATDPPDQTAPQAGLALISFCTNGGADSITIDNSGGPIGAPFQIDAGTGTDTLTFTNNNPAAGKVLSRTDSLTVTNGTLNVASDAGGAAFTAQAGTNIMFQSSEHLYSLELQGNAQAGFTAGGAKVLRTSNLTMSAASNLNLADNDLIVDADPATRDAVLAIVSAEIKSARNGGAWNGVGINSTAAANNAKTITSLAFRINENYTNTGLNGGALYANFDGEPVDKNAAIVKYTYNGDSDLSGKVDADDYFNIDRGFGLKNSPSTPFKGYANGDFDLTGSQDADDYFLIDSAFAQQGVTLSDKAQPASARSVIQKAKPRHRHHRPASAWMFRHE